MAGQREQDLQRRREGIVNEKLHCVWSIDERACLTLRPSVDYYANLFHLSPITNTDIYERIDEPKRSKIAALTMPVKNSLMSGINHPGQYKLKVTVTAKSVPAASEALIFEYRDYDNVSLLRQTDEMDGGPTA